MKKKQSPSKRAAEPLSVARQLVDKPMRKARPIRPKITFNLDLNKDIEAAAGELLRTLKNTRAWLQRNKLHCPPVNLDHMDKTIAQAEKAGIKAAND